MIKRLAVAAIAVIGIYSAVPASAEEVGVGVGVGPVGAGVTVGTGRPDYDRDRVHERTIIREREPRRDETVIIKKRNRDFDRDEHRVIIDRFFLLHLVIPGARLREPEWRGDRL